MRGRGSGAAVSSFMNAAGRLTFPKGTRKKVQVAVLLPTAEKDSTWAVDVGADECTPAHWVKDIKKHYSFTSLLINKSTAWKQIRELVSMKKYDVFYNLCDGAKDEDRPGVEVINALEAHNVPYTGADGRGFETSKIDMKKALAPTGVKYPNFVQVYPRDNIAKACKHLKFPVIVKHHSGYGSIGITAKSKCSNMDQLKAQVKWHIDQYDHALVEEFIAGREGTVFVCADPTSSELVKVFPPILMELGGPDDFAHFDNKWVDNSFTSSTTKPKALDLADPAQQRIREMAFHAFKLIMHGVGYGRCDFRIDESTGEPYFLEINPNCGMLYPPSSGGCYADVMVELDPTWNHDKFIATQIELARRQNCERTPWTETAYDSASRRWFTKTSRNVPQGARLFPDATKIVPLVAKINSRHHVSFDVKTGGVRSVPVTSTESPAVTGITHEGPTNSSRSTGDNGTAAPPQQQADQPPSRSPPQPTGATSSSSTSGTATLSSSSNSSSNQQAARSRGNSSSQSILTPVPMEEVSCAIYRSDGISDEMVPLLHSCNPNLVVEHGAAMSIVARTQLKKGTTLTIDYGLLRDESMPSFLCRCGAKNCRGVIHAQKPLIRVQELD